MACPRIDHITPLISPVPMSRSGGTPNDIAHTQFLGFPALVTDPTRASSDSEHLTLLMGVPMSAGAGGEHDVEDVDSLGRQDGVGPDVAGEGGSEVEGLFRFVARVVGDDTGHGGGDEDETRL